MTIKCPKCKRKLKQSGEVRSGFGMLPRFECVECVMYWKMEEDCFKMNLTFAVTSEGMLVDTAPPHLPVSFA